MVDAPCSVGLARLFLSKAPITAAETLHNQVLPFYDEDGVAVEHLLTGNGREFCGKDLQHPFALYLPGEVRSRETNDCRERFHRTVKEKSLSVGFRKTLNRRAWSSVRRTWISISTSTVGSEPIRATAESLSTRI